MSTDKHLNSTGIVVTVNAGVAVLSGIVGSWSARERAERVTAVVKGVRAVVNRARVLQTRRSDDEIAADVRSELRRTAALATMPIRARVTDGVVELTGSISSWEEQQLAERVAAAVPGVRFCQNQLTSRGGKKRTPAVIEGDIRSRLDWDPLLEHDPIRVSVLGDRVVLSGTVGGTLERREARLVSRVRGVSAVDASTLLIDAVNRPDSNLRLSLPGDAEISATLQDLAPYWPASSGVNTAVIDGVATLSGTVPSLVDSRAWEARARSAVGVREVQNQLRGPWLKAESSRVQRAIPRRH